MNVWVLTIDDDKGPVTSVHASEDGALRAAHAYASQLFGDEVTQDLNSVTSQLREDVDVYLDEYEVQP